MGSPIGLEERTARKEHHCLLCSLPILGKTKYITWGHADNGSFYRVKCHIACNAYASVEMEDEWVYGDGLTPGAVEVDLRDRLLTWRGYEVGGVDREVETAIRSKWPELTTLIDTLINDILLEYGDE